MIFISCSSTQNSYEFKNKIKQKYNASKYKLAFSSSSIEEDELNAIEDAKNGAIFELSKTLSIQIEGKSQSRTGYNRRNGEDFVDRSSERNIDISVSQELIGVESREYFIDRKQGIVYAYAVIDSFKFKNYLERRNRKLIKNAKKFYHLSMHCNSFKDLLNLEDVVLNIEKINNTLSILDTVPVEVEEGIDPAGIRQKCKEQFTFSVTAIREKSKSIDDKIKKTIATMGFPVKSDKNNPRGIKISYALYISPQEKVFGKSSKTGRVKIAIAFSNQRALETSSKEIREIHSSESVVMKKLNVKLGLLSERIVFKLLKK